MDEDYFNLKTRPKVIITMPELISLKLSGVVDCKSGHFGGDELYIELNGASKAAIDAEYTKIEVNMTGVSSLDISGKTKKITCEISGTSSINAEKLTMETAKINLTGVSEAIFGPAKTISGKLSGDSKLKYSGNPVLQVNSTGVSETKHISQ